MLMRWGDSMVKVADDSDLLRLAKVLSTLYSRDEEGKRFLGPVLLAVPKD